ncbi:methyl-accepting chemotaxis protein [Pararhodospirillum oryzae]|uniref:Chemotaxis protein n=1 Tax=Pararhodospirillum oryzae TaxID=478448 RepID=A0A512H8F6_9PROT|nr:cache domain-containing protein [Pararhodospirillum oryzae]GEO81680.1 chemotaxis protein [Pararhodospirillum oryzae]
MKTLTIRQQVLLVPLLSVVAVVLVAGFAAFLIHQRIDETHRLQIKSATEVAVTVTQALHAEAEAGSMTDAQAQAVAKNVLRAIRFAGPEYFYVYDYEGKLLAHPILTKLEGTYKLKETRDANGLPTIEELIKAAREGGGFVPFLWPKPGEKDPTRKLGYAGGFDPWGWMIGTGVYVDDVEAETQLVLIELAAGGAVSLALVMLVGLAVTRRLARRLEAQSARMLALAEGDLATPGAKPESDDEIGRMAEALEIFRQRMIENRDLAAAREAEQERRAAEADRLTALAKGFDAAAAQALDVVAQAAAELEKDAGGLSQAAESTAKRSVTVASAAEQASTNVQTVASATEELSASIGEISRQVADSTRIATDAVGEAERTRAHVRGLAEAAQRIGAVVNLITDIAAQTNLLALNATIEAARAGEAGKGFAVVAGEVKHLASQTAKATDEIGEQVTAIQQATATAVAAIDGIAGIINAIRDTTDTIAGAVDQQGIATREIASGVQQAAAGTTLVSQTIAEVNTTVEGTRQASDGLLDAAERLHGECDSLRAQVHTFLAEVRRTA